MDLLDHLNQSAKSIKCIDMHTTGEPARIIYSGYPLLSGTLVEQRLEAKEKHDHIRRRVMLEPRGHNDMFGAIIRKETELVLAGEAHIGVLYCHSDGYPTMCGHVTIALGRFLVDINDLEVFPNRNQLVVDERTQSVTILLHAPCGLIRVKVPVSPDGRKSDPARAVAFDSTPAHSVSIQIQIPIDPSLRWPQLAAQKHHVTFDVSYGGAYIVLIPAKELGFTDGLQNVDLYAMGLAVQRLKLALSSQLEIGDKIGIPVAVIKASSYTIILTDVDTGTAMPDTLGVETGLCFFGDNQIDRSPTGSGVSARMALAYAKRDRTIGQRWTYQSLVSNHFKSGALVGEIVKSIPLQSSHDEAESGLIIRVEGYAFFTGSVNFVLEEGDIISSDGFLLHRIAK